MSLIGTAIGALVALVPARRPEDDKTARLALKLADLSEKFDALTRTRQQLVNHIELIERQLDAERALASHWRGEAQRLAARNRVDREMCEELLQRRDNEAQRQNDLRALYNQAAMQQSQALAQYNQQIAAQSLLGAQQAESLGGFCNCVPSRAQVWGAHGGLVQRLNDRGD